MKKKTKKPLVSTLTPCFHMTRYLKTFLEKLPEQTIFEQLQVVLDHNEPTDEELGWVESFQKEHPGRLKHNIVNPVESIGISMNRCIELADSDLVAVWNVDDLRTPDSLEKQVNFLQDHPDHDIAYGNFVVVDKFQSVHGKFVDHSVYQHVPKEFTRSMILGPFFMWRKALCEKAGYFDEQLKSGADFDLAVRLAVHGKYGLPHGLLGYYLNEGTGLSTRPGSRQPVERTLVELRYGIFDKMESQYLPDINRHGYDIENIISFGKKKHVSEFMLEDYSKFKLGNSTS